MKISLVFLSLIAASTVAASRSINNHALKKSILSKSRRLEDQAEENDNEVEEEQEAEEEEEAEEEKEEEEEEEEKEEEEEEEYGFLTKYKLKLMSCKSGERVYNAENNEYDNSAVVFRLCPLSGDGCDDEKACSSGFGDYVVGLSTFVNMYMEDQRENMDYDDNFKVDEYAECREYDNDNNDGNFYIGPACTEDGDDIKLDMFYDEACTVKPEGITFADISNGWELPYGEGGLVSTYCQTCREYNENDGGYEIKEMCQELYEQAAGKCETEMEYYHYYGKQEDACEYITELLPAMNAVDWFYSIAIGTREYIAELLLAIGYDVAACILGIIVLVGFIGYVCNNQRKAARREAAFKGYQLD